MNGPSGPFTPWKEHPMVDGTCTVCGFTLSVPIRERCPNPETIWTHEGNVTIPVKPFGNIVKCVMLLVLLLLPSLAWAQTATLHWIPNSESDVAGYKIYAGALSCSALGPMQPSASVDKTATSFVLPVPVGALVMSARIAAIDTAGNISALSQCAEKVFPPPGPTLEERVTALENKADLTARVSELEASVNTLKQQRDALKAGWCALKGSSLTKDVLAERAALGGCL